MSIERQNAIVIEIHPPVEHRTRHRSREPHIHLHLRPRAGLPRDRALRRKIRDRHTVLVIETRGVVAKGQRAGRAISLGVNLRAETDAQIDRVPRPAGRQQRPIGIRRIAEIELCKSRRCRQQDGDAMGGD